MNIIMGKTEFEEYMEGYMIRPLVGIVSGYLEETELSILGYGGNRIMMNELSKYPLLMCECINNNSYYYYYREYNNYYGMQYELNETRDIDKLIEYLINEKETESIKYLIEGLQQESNKKEIIYKIRIMGAKDIMLELMREDNFSDIDRGYIFCECMWLLDGDSMDMAEIAYNKGYTMTTDLWGIGMCVGKYIDRELEDKEWGPREIMGWLNEKKCPYKEGEYNAAIERHNIVAMDWLLENKFLENINDTNGIYKWAARDEDGRILRWLHKRKVKYTNGEEIVTEAYDKGYLITLMNIFWSDVNMLEMIGTRLEIIKDKIRDEEYDEYYATDEAIPLTRVIMKYLSMKDRLKRKE